MINITRLLADEPSVSKLLNAKKNKDEVLTKPGPVVVFNLTRRCNLACRHCYLEAKAERDKDELSLGEIKKAIKAIKNLKARVLLLSGGEPLMRKDIFTIIKYAKARALRVALSTNGTLIDKITANKLKSCGINYVGISIDGRQKLHDKFRNLNGAFDKAMKGLRNCRNIGIKTGIRFTLTRMNALELPAILALCEKERIPRFCMYHLVYAGRGNELMKRDINNTGRRKIINYLIRKAIEFKRKNSSIEILTVDNHADGIYIYNYLKNKNKEKADKVLRLLEIHGGCSAGNKILDISPQGEVFACQFWLRNPLGNIKRKDFISLWRNKSNGFFCRLKEKKQYLKGKCSDCRFNAYCGGCRVRSFAKYGDFWQEDPNCYLSAKERGY